MQSLVDDGWSASNIVLLFYFITQHFEKLQYSKVAKLRLFFSMLLLEMIALFELELSNSRNVFDRINKN